MLRQQPPSAAAALTHRGAFFLCKLQKMHARIVAAAAARPLTLLTCRRRRGRILPIITTNGRRTPLLLLRIRPQHLLHRSPTPPPHESTLRNLRYPRARYRFSDMALVMRVRPSVVVTPGAFTSHRRTWEAKVGRNDTPREGKGQCLRAARGGWR